MMKESRKQQIHHFSFVSKMFVLSVLKKRFFKKTSIEKDKTFET